MPKRASFGRPDCLMGSQPPTGNPAYCNGYFRIFTEKRIKHCQRKNNTILIVYLQLRNFSMGPFVTGSKFSILVQDIIPFNKQTLQLTEI